MGSGACCLRAHLPVHPVLDVRRGAELVGEHGRHLGHLAVASVLRLHVSSPAGCPTASRRARRSSVRAWSRGCMMSEIMDVPLPRAASRPRISCGITNRHQVASAPLGNEATTQGPSAVSGDSQMPPGRVSAVALAGASRGEGGSESPLQTAAATQCLGCGAPAAQP